MKTNILLITVQGKAKSETSEEEIFEEVMGKNKN